jgi:chemotaxis protein histidine kinase CheA
MNTFYHSLLPAFNRDAGVQLESMDRALEALGRDLDDGEARDILMRAAHTIKGNSAVMGFSGLLALSGAMESAVRPKTAPDSPLPDEALPLFRQVAAALRGWITAGQLDTPLGQREVALLSALTAMATRCNTLIHQESQS